VTPPDSNGRVFSLRTGSSFLDNFPTEPISPFGPSVVYATYGTPVAEPGEASGTNDVYEARRSATGWTTVRRISPSGAEEVIGENGGVSADHRYAFTNARPAYGGGGGATASGGSLAEKVDADYLGNPDGTFELVGIGTLGSEPQASGRYISTDGSHVIFSTGPAVGNKWCVREGAKCAVRKLEPGAPPTGTGAVYDRAPDGPTRVVSLLPGDLPLAAGEDGEYQGASKDGRVVAFRVDEGSGGPYSLYVRVPDAGDGETLKVFEGQPAFAGISDEGRYLFYVAGGDIHRFNTETALDQQVSSTGDAKIVNVSPDGSHVYFVSESQIGAAGAAGQPNLYAWSGGATEFVATLAASDLVGTSFGAALGNWTESVVNPLRDVESGLGPGASSSRTTSNGEVLVFESRAKLTGYENAGHTEIYRYDANDGSLLCLSCNFLVAQAGADARLQNLLFAFHWIAIHNLSADGSRVFFETPEALVDRDSDGINDVYEWQQQGATAGVSLISSGSSTPYPFLGGEKEHELPPPNTLFGVNPSGEDVIFASQDRLAAAAGAGGTPAIYDARVGGGFPQPSAPQPCGEEGCRPAAGPIAPFAQGSASEAIGRSENLKPRKHRRCHRSARRGKKHRHCRGHRNRKDHAARASATTAAQMAEGGEGAAEPVAASGEALQAQSTEGALAPPSATTAASEFDEFGITSLGASLSTPAAGAHADFTTDFELNHRMVEGKAFSNARTEDLTFTLPPGLVGNLARLPRCTMGQLEAFGNCPIESQVGISRVLLNGWAGSIDEAVYNLEPPHPDEEIGRLGFIAGLYPTFIDLHVRTAGDYGVTAAVHDASGIGPVQAAETTLWGNPGDPSHDAERIIATEPFNCPGNGPRNCEAPGGRPVPPSPALMTNPSACQEGQIGFTVTSYELPGRLFSASAPLEPITDCSGLPFAPSLEAEPTSHVAGAPTGLHAKLTIPQHLGPEERATATMREARVTLPAGMQIAAGAANWIGTCSEEQVGLHREVDAACPDASKLGTVKILSPALSLPLEGNLYQRTPAPGHPFGLWLVSDELGLHVKLPGELQPDPRTGRLTAVFDDLPQVPVEEIDLDVWGGDRAPLQNPDACGTYTTDFSFSPHSADPAASGQSQMTIDQGCNAPFSPALHAGVAEPAAGRYSPISIDLTRGDRAQGLRGFSLELPDGELAKLKGVPLCPEDAAARGACPAASAIGSLQVLSGPGPDPLSLPQPGRPEPRIYLAGPYQGSPFSILTEVPAQAGPFDLGVLAVRSGLGLDPDTNRAVVDADPLPQFFEGVGIAYRHLHAVIDRPGFSLNPTDCRAMAVDSDITSTQGAVAHPAAPFQVHGCKRLKFAPGLSLKLAGGTERGDYPALSAALKARKGDANIGRVVVALPHSEFLAQEHIGTICTRKQFAADKCPKGSVYGTAKAWTPLLAKPLSGPVYLRSSDNPLPDLVAALGGELDVNLVGRIDSHHGGLRTTFAAVPDAPVTRFVLRMKGGAKSLLTNSTDICRGAHRARVEMRAQNGREKDFGASLQAGCGRQK
jgi:hypothetical protein